MEYDSLPPVKDRLPLRGWNSTASGIPKPGPLEVHLKDHHLQYAINWFGLAGAVVIAFGVWPSGRSGGDEAGNEGKTAFRTSHQLGTSMHAGVKDDPQEFEP